MKKVIELIVVFVFILANCIGIVSCNDSKQAVNNTADGSPTPCIRGELLFPDKAPCLYQPATLKFIIKSCKSVDNLSASIDLPEGIEFVSGDLKWDGGISADSYHEIIAIVKPVQTGNYTIKANLIYPPEWYNGIVAVYKSYLSVEWWGSEWGIYPPWQKKTGSTTEANPVSRDSHHGPLKIRTTIPEPPVVNQQINLTYDLSSNLDAPNTSVEVILRHGSLAYRTELSPRFDLSAKRGHQASKFIRVTEPGLWSIETVAKSVVNGKIEWADTDVIYLNVGTDNSSFGWPLAPTEIYQLKTGDGRLLKSSSKYEPPAKSLPKPPVLSPNGTYKQPEHHSITVTGNWYYWTKLGEYRVNPDTMVPAKYFLVELLDDNGNHKAWGYTDSQGTYSIAGVDPSGGIKSRLWCYVNYNGNELRVISSGISVSGITDEVYHTTYSPTYNFDNDGLTHSLGSMVMGQGVVTDGAWWIKDDLDRAYRYTSYTSGPCTVRWYETNTEISQYYIGSIVNLSGITERSPDVVLHEYGHNIMYTLYSGNYPPANCPSPHYIENATSASCAWSEGWASYFALAVNGSEIFTWPDDVLPNTVNVDYEAKTWGSAGWTSGDLVEGRITACLWDIYDSVNDDYDNYSGGFASIWSNLIYSPSNTFADFYNNWLNRNPNNQLMKDYFLNCAYQNTICYGKVAPRLENTGATGIVNNTATLNGNLSLSGNFLNNILGPVDKIYAYYGTIDGGTTPGSWASSVYLQNISQGAFSTALSGLASGQTYYYRFYGYNERDGQQYGYWLPSSSTFTTSSSSLSINTTSLSNGTVNTAYSAPLSATGGTGSYTWSLISGSLPVGLSLSSAGVISGTPTTVGTFNFTVQVIDSASNTATQALSITIVTASPTTYTITATAGANGSIDPSGTVTVNEGANQTFTITPNSGYSIATLTVDGNSITPASTYTFTNVTSNHSIAATFSATSPTTYTITATAGANGSISPSGTVSVNAGANQTFTVTPNSGYQIATLTVDGNSITPASTYTFTNVTSNHIIAATFTTAFTVSPASLVFNSVYGANPLSQNLTISGGSWILSHLCTPSGWLSASPTQGSSGSITAVSCNTTGLGIGTYSGQIIVGSPPNSVTIPVMLNVISPVPVLSSPADESNVAGNSITFSWNACVIDCYYKLTVLRASDNSTFWSECVGSNTSYQLDGFSDNGTAYKWTVSATTSANCNGTWGPPATYRTFTNGTTPTIPPVPVPISPEANATVSGTSITFTWNASSGATNYYFTVVKNSDSSIVFSQPVGNVTTYTLGNFPNNGTLYTWAVAAGNSMGWSAGSTPRDFTNGGIPPVPAPISPEANATVSGTSITFTWNASSGATNYYFTVVKNSDSSIVFSQPVGNVTTYTLGNFPNNGTLYTWAVAAGNSTGWSAGSTPRDFTNGP